jgi:hypothetical protein
MHLCTPTRRRFGSRKTPSLRRFPRRCTAVRACCPALPASLLAFPRCAIVCRNVLVVTVQAPWDMSFVQFAATVSASDTAWITGAERWVLNGTEVRTLPVDAVQGRSYLIKVGEFFGNYLCRI